MNLKNLEYIEKNNPVTKEEIDFAEKRINGELPKVYKEFLRYANGMVMNLCVLYDTQRRTPYKSSQASFSARTR